MTQQTEIETASADPYEIGRVVSRRYTFTADNIKAYADMAGDTNPLHHDLEFAKASRFGGLIASAAHSTGVLVSVLADKFASNGDTVGLGFSLTLRRAVQAESQTDLIWTITGKEWSDKLKGNVIEFIGEIREIGSAQPLVRATGRILQLNSPEPPATAATTALSEKAAL